MRVSSNAQLTKRRVAALKGYMEREVMDTTFLCPAYKACRDSATARGAAFYKGQLSHVGKHYDLEISGRPMRVVIVGQEYGLPIEMVELAKRYSMIHDVSGLGGFAARNPHMKGTTFALQLLLRGAIDVRDNESIDPDRGDAFHMFDAFALVNVLLCSAVVPGTKKGRSTGEMQRNCLPHFKATLDILEPTVIVAQGKGVRAWIAPLITRATRAGSALERVTIGKTDSVLCSFNHPSTPVWEDGWANESQPYLAAVVKPTLLEARRLVLGS